jgi:hypothetical protein
MSSQFLIPVCRYHRGEQQECHHTRVVSLEGVAALALSYLDDDPAPDASASDYIEAGTEVDLSLYGVDPQRVHVIAKPSGR